VARGNDVTIVLRGVFLEEQENLVKLIRPKHGYDRIRAGPRGFVRFNDGTPTRYQKTPRIICALSPIPSTMAAAIPMFANQIHIYHLD
jgi:hypothetical protein